MQTQVRDNFDCPDYQYVIVDGGEIYLAKEPPRSAELAFKTPTPFENDLDRLELCHFVKHALLRARDAGRKRLQACINDNETLDDMIIAYCRERKYFIKRNSLPEILQ